MALTQKQISCSKCVFLQWLHTHFLQRQTIRNQIFRHFTNCGTFPLLFMEQWLLILRVAQRSNSKKNMVFGPSSPYVHSRVDFSTFTMGNPMPESTLTLCQSRLYPPARDFLFGLCALANRSNTSTGKSRNFIFHHMSSYVPLIHVCFCSQWMENFQHFCTGILTFSSLVVKATS